MGESLDRIELIVDKVIPYLIIVLLGVIITDVFFHDTSLKYASEFFWTDSIIIGVFVVDLIFKYRRVRSIPRFLRLYWLDILAVFPFFLILRVFEEALIVSETSVSALRNLFHAGLVLEEGASSAGDVAKVATASEVLAESGRLSLLSEILKPLDRIPRFLKAISFYEHPNQEKTLYHKKKK